MPPKPDTAELQKTLASAFQQARSRSVNFAFVIGRDGPVFESDPRRGAPALWATARKQGGGNKGAFGAMTFDSGRLMLRCDEDPAATVPKAFKDMLASCGQTLRFEFFGPEAAKDAEEPTTPKGRKADAGKDDKKTKPGEADAAEEGEEEADDTDPVAVIVKARKRPMNIAWFLGPEGLVLRAHPRKPLDTLRRQAMAGGAQPRGALGVMTVSGKLIELRCEEAPPRSFPKKARQWLADLGQTFKIRVLLPSGETLDSEKEEEGQEETPESSAAPVPAPVSVPNAAAVAVPLAERLDSLTPMLDAARQVLDARQHAALQGLWQMATDQQDSDPGRAIKVIKMLEGRLAGLDLPPLAPATAKTESEVPSAPAPAPATTLPQPPTDPVEAITATVTPERKATIDGWLAEFGEYENAWQLWDDEGGEYVSGALLGRNAQLGALTEAEKVYLAREAARIWRHAGSAENIQEAIEGIGNDPAARRALALGFAASQAGASRIHAQGGHTVDSPEGANAAALMMQRAVDLDPAAVIEAFAGAEGELGRIASGGRGDLFSRRRQQGLLDAVNGGAVDPARADLMTGAIFLSTKENELSDRSYRAALAGAMGRVAGADETGATAAKLEAIFATGGGREMMFGEAIPPELRNWALAQAANNPDFTAEALSEGWESEVAAQAAAGPIAERYTARGLDPFALRTTGPTGALHNTIGQALGAAPTNLPPENETDEARLAREAAGMDHDYYAGDARIGRIAGMIAELGGDPAQMTVLPVVVTSNEFGIASFTVFRLERPEGPRFVDDMGNKYDSLDKWLDLNELPPGKMTYPEALVPGARLVTQNTPCVVDTLGEWLGRVGDGVALAAGITVGVIAIAGSGGLATPLVVAGAGAASWQVGRAGSRLYDDHQRGKDVTDLTDPSVRGNWLEAGAGVLSVGAMGAAMRAGGLVQSGARVTQMTARTTAGLQIASNTADAAAMGDQALMMAQNWDRMDAGDKAMGLLNVAFWAGMGAASTRTGGAMVQDALSFTRLRNQAEFGSPFPVAAHTDLDPGQMRTAYDLDATGMPVNVRIETGGGRSDPVLLALHSNAGRQVEAAGGLMTRLTTMLRGRPDPAPGTQGWEAKLEIEKIGAETDLLRQRLDSEGPRMTPLEREALLLRQQELAEATAHQMARLQDPDLSGEGWIAAPSEGHRQAEARGWPTGDALPEGHHWVSSVEGEPTLRRSDGTIERFEYDPVSGAFRAYSGGAGRTMSIVGHGENEIGFVKDASGRTVEAVATLRRYHVNAERSPEELAAQRAVGDQGLTGDDAGHMIGHRFGLDRGLENLFPQDANFNRGAYKKLENELADWIAVGGEVRVKITLDDFAGTRPAEVDVTYSIVDPRTGHEVYSTFKSFDNDTAQSYDRMSSADIQARMSEYREAGIQE
ncbi:DUF4781 domain-containing protein [Szabonella alba]|uniref:DUF4781 domain-containing protein n=1 Tax=Szabonella alba TaxID=2804194 RepID=A0A8K0VA34_9RHOB|nr:DUF4781 domain-containing protein [Szabonella alba]MBL4916423.1 DUF4781 domain-containing protein [Szabonella alba]